MQKIFTGICYCIGIGFWIVVLSSAQAQAHGETVYTNKSTETSHAAIDIILENEIWPLAQSPSVVSAIKQQNLLHNQLTQDQINTLDQVWRQETETTQRPLINGMLKTDISKELQSYRKSRNGLVTEVILIDNKGLNVGISDVTSDYWQGDEDKWQKTLLRSPKAVFVSEASIDESTQQFQLQISVTVVDPESSRGIGSLTVGVDLDLLELYLEYGGQISKIPQREPAYE